LPWAMSMDFNKVMHLIRNSFVGGV